MFTSDIFFDYDYEGKVKKLLKEKIYQELGQNSIIRENYAWPNNKSGWTSSRHEYMYKLFEFDLVVLDNNRETIKRIYEIRTPESVKSNYNFINKLLKRYNRFTGAKVFIAYYDKSGLQVVSMADFDRMEERIQPFHPKNIKHFSDFYKAIQGICVNASDIKYFFRGISNVIFDPIPNVFRGKNIENEDRMYKEAIRRNTTEFTKDMSTFDNLVKMQHYELPTRLLDITSNPLVALYFACKENDDADGKVLVYSIAVKQDRKKAGGSQLKYFDSDAVCVLSNLAKRRLDFDFYAEKGSFVYDIQEDKPSFDGDILEEDAIHEVFCVLPKLNNSRINCQKGAFFIFGMGKTKDLPAALPDRPVEIIIEASAKKDILKELELLGINEASLFPETDKIMKQIKSEFC